MRILIAYATRYGSTQEIVSWMAERIAQEVAVEVREIAELSSLEGYTHVVLGSPLYQDDLLPEVRRFIEDFSGELTKKAVGVFGVALSDLGKGLYDSEAGGLAYFDRFFEYLPIKPIYSRLLGGALYPERLEEPDRSLLRRFFASRGKQEIPKIERTKREEAWDYMDKFIHYAHLRERVRKRLGEKRLPDKGD